MFLLQYSLEVKVGEKTRLEKTLKASLLKKLISENKMYFRRRRPRLRRKKRICSLLKLLLTVFYKKMTENPWRHKRSMFLYLLGTYFGNKIGHLNRLISSKHFVALDVFLKNLNE